VCAREGQVAGGHAAAVVRHGDEVESPPLDLHFYLGPAIHSIRWTMQVGHRRGEAGARRRVRRGFHWHSQLRQGRAPNRGTSEEFNDTPISERSIHLDGTYTHSPVGVQAILYELLHDAHRTLDHLSGGNAIDHLLG
jgi:hypothetical protein